MIEAKQATEYIANTIKALIDSEQIKGKLEKSKSSISIYLRSKDINNPPPKYFRGSNHHITHASLLNNRWKPWVSKNICVEFYEPRYDKDGKKLDNNWNLNVRQNSKGTVKPFYVETFIYTAANLEETDVPIITDAVKNFLKTGEYTDPFANNPQKKANPFVKNARIKPSNDATVTNMTLTKQGNPLPTKNLSYDKKDIKHTNDWGADYVSESKDIYNYNTINCNKYMNRNRRNVVRLTESKLREMIKESVRQTISEMNWKSYADSGVEASKRGDRGYWREKENLDFPEDARKAMQYRDKANAFYDAARNALNRDFGYQRGKYGDSNYTKVSMGGDFTATGEFTPHALGQKDDPMTRPHRYERGWHEYHGEKTPEEFFDDDPEAAKAYRRMEDEIKAWKDGEYTYQNGKGWIKK